MPSPTHSRLNGRSIAVKISTIIGVLITLQLLVVSPIQAAYGTTTSTSGGTTGGNLWLYVGIGVVVILAAIILVVFLRNRRHLL